MAVADCTICAYRVPGQNNLRKRPRARFRFYSGFTLIELLVVIAIIAILAGILFPVFASAKESGRRAKCLSNLKQISMAWQLYADSNSGRACPTYYYGADSWTYNWDITENTSVDPPRHRPGLLGPYCKNDAINACPLRKDGAWGRQYTGYAYNATYIGGDPKNTPPRRITPCSLSDICRPSRTVLVADAAYGVDQTPCNYLRAPSDGLFSAGTVNYRHSGSACVAYADGHVACTSTKYRSDEDTGPMCGALSEDDSAYDLK